MYLIDSYKHLMRIILLICVINICSLTTGLTENGIEVIDQEKLADAIKKEENSCKYPYGIKSVNTGGDEIYSRKICIQTINANLPRWQWSVQHDGYKKDFIEYLGSKYCPGDMGWVENVRKIYGK